MSGGMPELGSKISLISKADIRYEGRLYTVDPQECTIALSNVRSFGTEDRETQFQIAPQSQIYDYILFRGSDIKDIRVVNNNLPHPNDPAIMQVQLQNGQHMMPHFPMPNLNPPHAPPMSAVGGYGNPFGMGGLGIGGAGGGAPSLAPGAPAPYVLGGGNQQQQPPQPAPQPQQQQQPQQSKQQQQKQPNVLAGASRSTTPMSHVSQKSSSPDMLAKVDRERQRQNQHSNSGLAAGRDAGQKRQNHQQRGGSNNQRNNNNNDFFQQPRDRRDSGRHADGAYNNQHHEVRAGNNYSNQRNNHQRSGGGGGGGGQNHAWTMHRGNPNNGNNMMRNRGGGRGRMQNQGYRPMGGLGMNQNKPRNPKNTIKFLQDFDFEQANVKFEELRSQLSKLKVGEEPKTEQMNGETEKKDDSGNETGAGEHEPEEEEITVGYDKTKSFFDNISCEAAQDRSKNKKIDWRQERKLNSETFGVSSTRRGGYRGRGSYYNRNMGSYGDRFNRNHRGGGNYRYRSRNPNAASNSGNGGTSNSNTGNSGASNNTNNGANTAEALKNQVQQPQPSAMVSGSTPNATKSATVENSNTPQPIAAGGSGQ
ncbi:protein LSM14 homolog B isoform X1 [Anastrepha ludens]|uniref:protein LSM14 homolog B isoform X1 n=2 Tax=Anastrepha ludens TaxID=28586 RepID=UPI0023AFDC4C|nr:protein LSM14 homolog B isoform X1 [Anastrepha ludens]